MLSRLEIAEEYSGLFLSAAQAETWVNAETLLIVVDAHRPSYVEGPSLLKKAGAVAVIDHHRRGAEFIEDAALVYHEPYASSACEMVTEILQYVGAKAPLSKLEAEALYAGIAMDTKFFTFKTGVRTFEAAAYLKRFGVDAISIKTLFQQDLSAMVKRLEILKAAMILRDSVAISSCPETGPDAPMLAAQAADDMLDVRGVTASFVLCRNGAKTLISGRSLGSVNVQLILEKLGGGGHLAIAGAQIASENLDEAREKLIEAIHLYFDESIN
jgi:c-di-AMP phosphodiesterase-like protein